MLLLSDMHFGEELLKERPSKCFPIDIRTRLISPVFHKAVRDFFYKKCKGHDLDLVKILPLYLTDLVYRNVTPAFDICLLLGDQATIPTENSYELLANYLTRDHVNQSLIESKGLSVSLDKLLAIPGNHDKLLLQNLDRYNESFGKPLQLLPMEKNEISFVKKEFQSVEFLFILIDGNAYTSSEDRTLDLNLSLRNHLACGCIDRCRIGSLQKSFDDLAEGKNVNGIQFQDFSKVIRILMVHYAVDMRRFWTLGHLWLPHRCKGLKVLIASLKSQIDVVLHGHLHQPKIYRYKNVPVISATTTSQIGGINGFYTLKFDEGEMKVEYHVWDNNHFRMVPEMTKNIDLRHRF